MGCPTCGILCFARRSQCMRCSTAKPVKTAGFSLHGEGDWVPFGGIHPDIEEFCEHYGIDERATERLNEIMTQRRQSTWNEDLARFWEDCETAKSNPRHNPTRLVMKKVTDMYNGTFVGAVAIK